MKGGGSCSPWMEVWFRLKRLLGVTPSPGEPSSMKMWRDKGTVRRPADKPERTT